MTIAKKAQTFRIYSTLLGVRQTLWLHIARILRIPSVDLMIPQVVHKIKCRPLYSDRFTLLQVFFEHDSDVQFTDPPRFIIDGGANVGYASVLLANKYPGAHILAIEPDHSNYQLALRNCAPYTNIKVVQGAIWTSNTGVSIENPSDESWAFRVRQANGLTSNTVSGYTIAKLLTDSGHEIIDLLKLDIEGAEEYIFSDPDTNWIKKVKVVAIEVHGDSAYQAVTQAFAKYNFAMSMQGEKLIFRNKDL